ncbi:hypothetical protein DERP_014801 [Dermatophagoides pteronyssinus]|uniref:Uncharacterized protein n=1 Tax=Dermatophagoides pteronyssinus TaxID=6956 RepID=A0ABQ8J2F8_DERPT|nr:hypothetical protein DERP_014801 [Dermatophagoides pteronyssinus]
MDLQNKHNEQTVNNVDAIELELLNDDVVIDIEENSANINNDYDDKDYHVDDSNCFVINFYKLVNFWMYLIMIYQLILNEFFNNLCGPGEEFQESIPCNKNRSIKHKDNGVNY